MNVYDTDFKFLFVLTEKLFVFNGQLERKIYFLFYSSPISPLLQRYYRGIDK